MNIALIVIFAFLALALFLGIRARRGQDMDLEQWTVGGRGFGTLFVLLLLAGEIYTTFTFLGGSGWAYGEGGPAFYILSYGCLAYVMSYWLLPAIWRYATEHRLHSQSDFFVKKYDSKGLGVFVSLVAVVAMVPYLALPAEGYSISWFVSTVLLTALGFYMWPHYFTSTFSADNERIFRRNAIFLPLYQLVLLFVFFVGFAAMLQVPGLSGERIDESLLLVSREEFGPFVVGLIGATGLLTALVPGSIILMVASTVLAKNVFGALSPSTGERSIGTLASVLVPVVALVSLWFSQQSGQGVVLLLLLGYSLVTQLFPAVIFSLMQNNFVTKWGAAAGIAAGVATVTYVTAAGTAIGDLLPFLPQALADTNIGIVALFINFVVLVAVSFATGGFAVRREQSA